MSWIKIGNHIVNASSIVELIDRGELELASGKQRVIEVFLVNGKNLEVVGAEADAVWAAIRNDLVVWTETLNPPKHLRPLPIGVAPAAQPVDDEDDNPTHCPTCGLPFDPSWGEGPVQLADSGRLPEAGPDPGSPQAPACPSESGLG
jgi:hypothetical protein